MLSSQYGAAKEDVTKLNGFARYCDCASSAACWWTENRHVCRPQLHQRCTVCFVLYFCHTYTAYCRRSHLCSTAWTDLLSHPIAWRILCFLPQNSVGLPYVMRRKLLIVLILTFWRQNYFFLILAHPVYKMWIIQEPNTLELWKNCILKRKNS